MAPLVRVSIIVVVVVVLLERVDATPVQGNDRQAGAIRGRSGTFPRQAAIECDMPSDCFPPGVTNAPTDLIDCDGQCLCNECFDRGPNGTCVDSEEVCDDYYYDSDQRECVDDRPSQLVAFLLSLFLSSTGAANFYIGQDGLGAGQLVILLVVFACSYALCCLPCCLVCCMDKENIRSSIVYICFTVLVVIVEVCCTLALWAWWIADLVIFATNERDAGNGCSLREKL